MLPKAIASHRVGITGVPGVGKSTFIDALGTKLTGEGRRVAVLAVDPSSTRTGGSILGDKTRMDRLAVDPDAFIRPSPTSGTLGGVAAATREAIVIVEAAGYDVVLVETVGVGQSETTVANLTDTFLVLMLARTGDSLQGIKKGVLELADVVTVNKADGKHRDEARHGGAGVGDGARTALSARRHVDPAGADVQRDHRRRASTTCGRRYAATARRWRPTVRSTLGGPTSRCRGCGRRSTTRCCASFRRRPDVRDLAAAAEAELRAGTITPGIAARRLLSTD